MLVFLGALALIVPVVVRQLFTLIAGIPATIDLFMASGNYRRLNEAFFVVYFVYMEIEAYIRAIAVPGILVVVGALVGGTLLGLLGALVAVPVTASVLLVIKEVFIPLQDAKTEPMPT